MLYINDSFKVTESLKFVIFADDTNLFGSGKNIREPLDTVKGELEILKKCFLEIPH